MSTVQKVAFVLARTLAREDSMVAAVRTSLMDYRPVGGQGLVVFTVAAVRHCECRYRGCFPLLHDVSRRPRLRRVILRLTSNSCAKEWHRSSYYR